MNRSLFLSALLTFFLLGCTVDTAGVITETESGKTIAGIVTDVNGKPLPKVQVTLIDSVYIAARPSFKRQVLSDDSGRFSIDSVPNGAYHLAIIDTLEDRSSLSPLSLLKTDSSTTIDLENLSLQKNAAFNLGLSLFNLQAGDTLCLTGTLSCQVVSEQDYASGFMIVEGITAHRFKDLTILRAKASTPIERINIDWELESKATLYITDLGNYFSTLNYTKVFDEKIEQTDPIDSMPVPFFLPSSIFQPMLINGGNAIPLESVFTEGDSTLYWGIIPHLDLTTSKTMTFAIVDSALVSPLGSPIRTLKSFHESSPGVIGKAKEFSSTLSPVIISEPVFQDSSVGISFWLKIDGKAQASNNSVIVSARSATGKGFDIRQRDSNDSISIGVRLYSDTTMSGDTLIIAVSDTIVYGAAKILDDTWHHYTLAINKAHLSIIADGELIRNTDIKINGGFYNPSEFSIGSDPQFNGTLDEMFIFNGSQDTSWLKMLYEIQRLF